MDFAPCSPRFARRYLALHDGILRLTLSPCKPFFQRVIILQSGAPNHRPDGAPRPASKRFYSRGLRDKKSQDNPLVQAIAQAASELVTKRDAWLNPADATPEELNKRTLTNLYNKRPAWLADAHRKLDEAVFAAYGMALHPHRRRNPGAPTRPQSPASRRALGPGDCVITGTRQKMSRLLQSRLQSSSRQIRHSPLHSLARCRPARQAKS